jgi:hypothetical protein
MAAQTIEYNIKINDGQATRSIADIESELAGLNDEIKQVDTNSEAFKRASKNIQQLQGELVKATDAVNGLTAEDKIRGFQGSIDILGGSVATLVGGIGLLGIESENFDKFTAYAANAIAFSSGLRTAAQGAVDLGMSIQKAGGLATIFGNVTKKALISTGIGALVVAVGLLIAYWDDLVKAVKGSSAEMKVFEATQEEVIKQQTEFNVKVYESENAINMARKGIISKRDALKIYNERLGDSVGYADSLNQAEELLSKNSAIILQQIRLRTQAQALYAKSAEMAAKAAAGEDIDPSFWQTVGNGLLSFGNQARFVALQAKTTVENSVESGKEIERLASMGDSLTQQAIELQNQLQKGAKSPKQKEEEKRDQDEQAKKYDELKKRAKELSDAKELLGKSDVEKAKILAQREYEAKIEGFKIGSQAQLDAKALYDAEIKRIDDEAFEAEKVRKQEIADLQADLDEAQISNVEEQRAFEIEQLNAYYDNLLLLAEEYGISAEEVNAARNNAITNANKKFVDEAKALQEKETADRLAAKEAQVAIENAKWGLLAQAAGIAQELAGKNKAVAIGAIIATQAAAIGQTIASTGLANAKAVATSPLTFGQPWVTINTISAGLSIAASILAAKKAIQQINSSSTQAPSASAPAPAAGGAGASAASPQIANPFATQAPGISPEAQGGGTAVRAYVIAGDVTSSQEANAKLSTRREID